jgi:hypothetical protein
MTQQDRSSVEQSTDLTDETVNHGRKNGLTLNERFEILKNERRRSVLKQLSGRDDTIALSSLADQIAAIENETTIEDVTSSERKRVYVALYQFHLPKMDRMGVIDYNKDRGTVSLTQDGRQLYQKHETEQNQNGYLDVIDLCACLLGAVVLTGVILTQAWFVGSVFLGVQTTLLGGRFLLTRLS